MNRLAVCPNLVFVALLMTSTVGLAQDLRDELIFPLDPKHNHAPGIVECPNGDLLVSWYRGSGERTADDVMVLGSRLKNGSRSWSEPFVMVDTPLFPDCNTCMWIDPQEQLWLFWPIVIANSWESCLTQALRSEDYLKEGAPKWSWQSNVLLKPDDFSNDVDVRLDPFINSLGIKLDPSAQEEIAQIRSRLKDKLYQRLGWQPRCKPTLLKNGRLLLPLYSDTFSISIMAISDDGGKQWRASKPLIGFGNIQPTVLERSDGTLVAYMRENGFTGKIRVCESSDHGDSWGEVTSSSLLNPGAGIDGVRLASGEWVLIYNDLIKGRHRLAVSLSDDEGKSWKFTRHLENKEGNSYHYPAIIQGKDGLLHAVYSYFVPEGKSMKHVAFSADWIRGQ